MNEKINVLIVDDHPLFRKGLKAELSSHANIIIAGEAGDAETTLKMVKEVKPEIIVLDINLPGKNGIEIAKEIKDFDKEIKIIFLTMYNEEDLFNAAFDAGASAYILKENAIEEALTAVTEVYNGGKYICSSMGNYLLGRQKKNAELALKNPGIKELSEKEREILKLIAQGKTSKEIGERLFISYKTVENHRTRICGKLGIKGSFPLLKFAIENKSHI
ncbi:MAG: response regulator transcription factor [Chlorobi bacterium]|nr:response regulator transcription factor [Chlorobiota bacterium]